MERYNNPHDKKVYDIEQIKEWARQDVFSEMAAKKEKKQRRQMIISGVVLLSMCFIMIYFLWKFAQRVQLL